jgi:pilus assembly protein CpaE
VLLLVDPSPDGAGLPSAIEFGSQRVFDPSAAQRFIEDNPDVDVVLIAEAVDLDAAFALSETLRVRRPEVGVILIRARVGANLLARALRAGMRDVLDQRETAALTAAVLRNQALARQIRSQGAEGTSDGSPEGRTITVFSAKGGCGKTTISTNLAAVLADGGKREVVLLDADLAFGDVAVVLQLFPAHTITEAVPMGDGLDAGALDGLLTQHSPGLWTVAAPTQPGTEIPVSVVMRVLQLCKQRFDFVVVDTPPAFTEHVLALLDQTDVLILLATLDVPALRNLKLTVETLDLLKSSRDRWAVVINRADSKVGLALSEVEKNLGLPIAAEIPSSRAVPATINRGVPIVLDQPKHPVSVAIRRLAERHVLRGAPVPAMRAADPSAHRKPMFRKEARS